MDKYKILIVEDDVELATLTAGFFNKYEFDCCIEPNAKIACERLLSESYDLLFLDLMLPEMDGFEVCRLVRERFQGKIIMLTARTDVIDQVVGLELGADDYIPKPVEPRLLLAKARAQLRKNSVADNDFSTNQQSEIRFEGMSLDRQKRKLQLGQETMHLGSLEFTVMDLFFTNPGKVISRDTIFKQIRGIEYDGVNRQVDLIISRLRAKIELDPKSPEIIKTVRNQGYILVVAEESEP